LQSPKNEPAPDAPQQLRADLKGDRPAMSAWTLTAYNKKVVQGWERLARETPENVANAYDWLRDCWCYEIGSGDRLYYKPDRSRNTVIVYYAGPHPKERIPAPPKDL
jgi:hypothetical protein